MVGRCWAWDSGVVQRKVLTGMPWTVGVRRLGLSVRDTCSLPCTPSGAALTPGWHCEGSMGG